MTRFASRLMMLLVLLLFGGRAALAQLPSNHIAVKLAAETGRPAAGSTVTLAFVMTPEQGWHGYWKNPGDAGVETRVDWALPAGVTAGPLLYPVPQRLTVAGLMNYVYEGPYAHLVELAIPAGLAEGAKLPVRAGLDYLACTEEVCVPQHADVGIDLIVGPKGAPLPNRAQFDAYRQALPKPLGGTAHFEMKDGAFRLAIPFPASLEVDRPYFFPLTDGALAFTAPQNVTRNGDYLIVENKAGPNAAGLSTVEGVLRIGDHDGLAVTAEPGLVPAAGTELASAPGQGGQGGTILAALFGALLGGLLLNIMPCVFPILSLKALSLAKAGGDEGEARREALAYTGGVILVCLALGGVLLALRAGGSAAGWAFQLQDPRVILVLLLLVTAIALNLAGLFELPAITGGERLARSGGTAGAFWTGALAAFIATPCTGPFMGAALGAALVLPIAAALAVFAGLGLGLALPFLALGFVPALRRRLPRPGPWMGRLRRILSVPMFLTALGLAWVLSRQSGPDGMAIGIGAAVVLGLALWWVGRQQGKGRVWLPLAPAALAAVAALVLVPTVTAPAAAQPEGALAAEPFSEAKLASLRAEGRPVFVYFTADWCLTCKVNEKGALERGEVARAFAAHHVAVLVGDWTRGDPEIGRFLERHGRSGVPLYLYYAPGQPVRVLPQILTPGELTGLVG